MMMKWQWAAALVFTAMVSAVPVSADTLKFGNEGTYPPFSILASDGTLTGMEPELAREMCKRLNADCEIVAMDLKALIPAMLQGKLDGITTQLTPTPERKERVLFSRVILQNNYRWVVPVDSHYQYTKEGLKGVKVGLQARDATIASAPNATQAMADALAISARRR